jgi:hypothetical protein
MKKVLFLNSNALRKVVLMIFFSIMLLSLTSCAAIMDSLLGNSTCIEPGCDRDARKNASYCIIHSDKEYIEVDTSKPYKLHKPMSDEEMKTKVKINRKNY